MGQGLLGVRTFVLPRAIVAETVQFLQKVGAGGFEGFALWAGTFDAPKRFRFSTCVIPEQRAMLTQSGLLVTVSGKALFDVNKALHARGEILAAQIHSHPRAAYHSDTDDAYPLVTLVGGLSVVVPDFARNAPADIDEWAWYRLSNRAKWEPTTERTTVEIE
jgi:hypothetical protein